MGLQLQSVRLGTPRKPDEGLRIGTVRYLPRGVRKKDLSQLNFFDVWLPVLAPSRSLLAEFRRSGIPTNTFFRRYRAEMKQPECQQLIQLLAKIASRTPLSIGCYCEHESRCHRSVLFRLIEQPDG